MGLQACLNIKLIQMIVRIECLVLLQVTYVACICYFWSSAPLTLYKLVSHARFFTRDRWEFHPTRVPLRFVSQLCEPRLFPSYLWNTSYLVVNTRALFCSRCNLPICYINKSFQTILTFPQICSNNPLPLYSRCGFISQSLVGKNGLKRQVVSTCSLSNRSTRRSKRISSRLYVCHYRTLN